MLNKIEIHGYLGRDPEKKTIEGQKGPYSKTTVSVGVSRDFGDDTDWFYCVFYGAKADAVEKWFRKGSQIIVTGRMESYKPKNDPNHTAWLLNAETFDFCDRKEKAEPAAPAQTEIGPLQEEDVPF